MRIEQFCNQVRDFRWGIEFPGFLPTAGGKVFNQIFVSITDNVQRTYTTRLQVKIFTRKVFQQLTQDGVLLFFFTQAIGVKRNILEHAFPGVFQFGAIGFFDGMQCLIDTLTVTRLMTALIKCVKTGAFRQHEALIRHHGFNQLRRITILFFIIIIVILPDI